MRLVTVKARKEYEIYPETKKRDTRKYKLLFYDSFYVLIDRENKIFLTEKSIKDLDGVMKLAYYYSLLVK
ncbi:hypothetical protein D3C87_1826470 [compost metagenome]